VSRRMLEQYLRSLYDDYSSGEAAVEVSGYGALQTLLNTVGEELNPRVRAVLNPKNRGAGTPDGGLFTSDQFRREDRGVGNWPAQLPSRGAVEVKGLGEHVEEIARGEQVERYLARYGQVLVTNYRDFMLVGQDNSGGVTALERYTLAQNEDEFWTLASNRDRDDSHAERFYEFLTRTLAYGAPLRRAEDLAWFLASYARQSLSRLESHSSGEEMRALSLVRNALERALSVSFEGDRAGISSALRWFRHSSTAFSLRGCSGASAHLMTLTSGSTGGWRRTR
jgi:hypothetical protein